MKLRFLKSWGYNGEIVRAGAVRSDISDFWATKFVAEGVAVEEKSTTRKAVEKVLETVAASPAPGKGTKKLKTKK